MIDGCVKHDDYNANKKECINCRRANYSLRAQRDRKRLQEFLDKYKLEQGCAKCGYKENVFALEFDHIKPREDTSKKWQTPKYMKAALALVADSNIQVLCANCHKIKTRTNNDHKARPVTNKKGNK